MRRIWQWALCLALLMGALNACAESPTVSLPVSGGEVEVCVTRIGEENWLFLPAFADVETLFPGAEPAGEADVLRASLPDGTPVLVMRSQNLRALFLFSDDPAGQGRAYVENCERHVNRATGSMALVDARGRVNHTDRLRQLRGRGNGTWDCPKKSYQLKLENRIDLLDTGEPSERARTWVLLAEATDTTFLHNKLALDLGLELGLLSSARSEYVDLYYDGEYRGLYLLTEKCEVDEARIDEMDYEKLIETWNRQAGQNDLDALEAAQGMNGFGNPFTYIQGLEDNDLTQAGAYMLEMESPNGSTLSDRCWFRMSDQSTVALKNPENASEPMARFISERLTEARQTLQNGGVHPENGRAIEDDFDVEAFAGLALLNELAYNLDGFAWSSTFFILPAGESRFKPGPPWDFDLGWRYTADGKNALGIGFKDTAGWLREFYTCPSFAQAMRRIYEERLYPLVRDVLLGDGQGVFLRSLDAYSRQTAASRAMNGRLWETQRDNRLRYGDTYAEELSLLRQFLGERSAWLYRVLVENRPEWTFDVIYGHPQDGLRFDLAPWSGLELVSYTSTLEREATEESYGVWRVEALFASDAELRTAPVMTVNGRDVATELLDDGTVRCVFDFTDISYRPVDYLGDDLGLIFDYETYVRNYPEVLELCGDDPEAALEYFCDEGMYEGQMANAFFAPSEILLYNPGLEDMLGRDWQNYYWEFLYSGYEEGWLKVMGKTFRPAVTQEEP